MKYFGQFSKYVDDDDEIHGPCASPESQLANVHELSITREIEQLHKIKEVRDELQILQRVSKLQKTIYESFVENDKERFARIQPEENANINAGLQERGEHMSSFDERVKEVSGAEGQANEHNQQSELGDRNITKFPQAISNNVDAVQLLIEHADEAQTAVSLSLCPLSIMESYSF